MSQAVLRAVGVHKRYGGVRALRGVDFELRDGAIHGLVGENGSGKSTLLRILSGQLAPDAGEVLLSGTPVRFGDAAQAMQAGIATVTQETTLVLGLSVAENIFLGPRKERRWYGIDWRKTRSRARAILERLELDLDPDRPVAELRPDQQQMVEIARALSMNARVVILDEPTSSLSDDEVNALFSAVRALRREGVATAFVSHRLSEVFDLVDAVTVLRDGSVVGSGPIGKYDRESLIGEMIGRALEHLDLGRHEHVSTNPVLRVRDFSVPGRVEGIDLAVERGEIVGLAGLVGAGRSGLLEGLFGLHPTAGGTIEIDGKPAACRDPVSAMRLGLGYVPADRKTLGLVQDMTVRENLLMAHTARTWRLRRPSAAREQRLVEEAIGNLGIVVESPNAPVARLSGGNQQKVVLAKWLANNPKVLLLDEPTRGVDVGAKAEIYRLLNEIKETGVGILVSSSETPELRLLCDRILVMYRGRVAASFTRAEATEAQITRYAVGHA
ncbi:MAG: sugar ABC transporter ATP-binding protein [Solirubrobacterales bacterium]|nr:sugar ABC transporter ATP-binding protein [Solirubrobacterales bacterium]